ncbi:HlyD family secretion protein [Opitutus sp. GAS368]|jgi:membrane fusion protein (multidrug efflux system)|uniref:HlyD family secretion protein n=1 Tax=Opitutus sp. GAS368 TaxID=1882749 RepID=UPI00087CDBA9|nr:HlyD family secretion protein [Opitutus sp. GAS368]SDR65708.1 membrane fusion protein, multidrug efflux system [Opitutus sp. GAS368]
MNAQSTESPAHAAPAAPPHHAARRRTKGASFWKPALLGLAGLALVLWLGRLGVHAYRYVGTDDAYLAGHLHQIGPQLEGQVKEVLVRDNQTVQAGDILVRLDPLEFELAVQKSRAALEQAQAAESQTRATAAQSDTQVAEAEARVKQAGAQQAQSAAQLELARLTLKRNEQLFARGGVVSQADLDNARSAFQAAEAADSASQANVTADESGVASARAAQKSAYAQIAVATASTDVAKSALRDAERKLGYATITAPTAGRIGNKAVEAGNHVLPGQILLMLAESSPWIIANFKETQLAGLAPGQDVEVTVDALSGETLHGRIDSLSPASGAQFALLPPDNATGNFNKVVQRVPVKILLDPASLAQLGDRLRFGYSVVVDVRVR